MSFKKSLFIILTIFSILPVVLLTLVAYGLISQKLNTVQTQNLQQMTEANKSGLEAMIETQSTEISLLAIQEEFQELAHLSNLSEIDDSFPVKRLLTDRKNSYTSCEMISVYNYDKVCIASSDSSMVGSDNKQSLTLAYMNITRKTACGISGLQTISRESGTVYCIEIGSPIFEYNLYSSKNELIGYIVSTISISYFEDFLGSITIGETGSGMLLDIDGHIIYHTDHTLTGSNVESDQLSNLVSDYNNRLIPESGTFTSVYEDTKQAFGYYIIPSLDWVLLIRQDTAEINSVIYIMLSILVFSCASLILLILLSIRTITKKITDPIIALRDVMRTASDGNLNVQSNINIKGNNELGELSKSFNKMLHIIKTNYDDLTSMHEELISNEEQLRSNYDHIEFLAYHDALTSLPNKLSFLDRVNASLVSPLGNSTMHAVYFVDLDNFKTINDTLGHEYGDALLAKTAQILSSIIEDGDMLARAGGDEFLIFKDNIKSKEEAVNFASHMIECFHHPLELDKEIVYVSMSVGIAIYPQNGITPNSLIKNADIAMYRSKDTGKNKFTLFNKKMEEELSRNTLIIEVLRNAITNHEIYLQYQPLFDLTHENIIGFEALMRINSVKLGPLSPSEFIPIAEESGLIIELSTWALLDACSFNKELIDQGIATVPVSVNISWVQINRTGFVALISSVLNETGLPPQYLELELTESTLVSSLVDATTLIANLQSLGVRISLDDFGTGFSSLNYLTRMSINTLKIDKSFIDNICHNDRDSFIAKSIIQLAHSLNITVVAEGVEHNDQLDLLRLQKCDVIQGYIYSRPLNSDAFIEIIRKVHQIK